jgi:Rps23 Pro-64 3,4-dihydroxylase Tpa1-like proline 4-hydroxylase
MVRVRILLQGGYVYETLCAADSSVLRELLSAALTGGGAPGLAQLQVEQDGTVRGLAFPYSQIVAVETEPPFVFQHYSETRAIRPAPYIRIPGFLSTEENRAVMNYAIRKQPAFQASTVEGGKQGYRHSQVLFKLDDLGTDFEARVRELLPEVCRHIGLALPADFIFEMQMTTHGEGGHFKIHNDNSSPGTASRFLTYVYYFHGEPAGFSGGSLRLYDDSTVEASHWVPVATFAEIKPENNMLLFFPSRHFHEVLPTLSRTGDFADGRFTINGWIRNPA